MLISSSPNQEKQTSKVKWLVTPLVSLVLAGYGDVSELRCSTTRCTRMLNRVSCSRPDEDGRTTQVMWWTLRATIWQSINVSCHQSVVFLCESKNLHGTNLFEPFIFAFTTLFAAVANEDITRHHYLGIGFLRHSTAQQGQSMLDSRIVDKKYREMREREKQIATLDLHTVRNLLLWENFGFSVSSLAKLVCSHSSWAQQRRVWPLNFMYRH